MLKVLGRKRLNLYFLIFVSIVGFGLLIVSRFNATTITPATNAMQDSAQATQTELLQPTDKTELAQTETIEVKPSEEVTNAQQSMPAEGTYGYRRACQNLKRLYVTEHTAKLQAEASRFASAQQEIINKYNREGISFSSAQKSAQAREAKRHELVMKQINGHYQTQLNNLSC